MKETYEQLLDYDIYGAIKLIGKSKHKITSLQAWEKERKNNPAIIPNNPLLTDYDWVYEHAEQLLCQNKLDYQQHQGFEAYYTLFKALINKYPLEEDYNKLLYRHQEMHIAKSIEWKWYEFAHKLLDFMNYAFDERFEKLLNQEDVIEYLLRYPAIFSPECMSMFGYKGLHNILQYDHIASYYTKNHSNMIQLIRSHPYIKIPTKIMLDKHLIKDIARTHNIERFYYELEFISEQVSEAPYLEEHKKFCDEQIANIKDGILPCYQERYKKASKRVCLNHIEGFHNPMEKQIIYRIFERHNLDSLPKKFIYQELSKYMMIGMFISRNYQTDPYNLLIDIETLHEFSTSHNIELLASPIYDLLTSFEERSSKEIIEFYNHAKTLPLMEMLYDDWSNTKNRFIFELNSSIFTPTNQTPQITATGITYYDITDIEEPIIVHNTSVPIDDANQVQELIEIIKTGKKGMLCLSIQDQNHNCFHEKEENQLKNKKTIKLAFGPLDQNRVGIISHDDAYSIQPDRAHWENKYYKRRHYTLDEFMNKTTNYNEITYVIEGTPFHPLGIICEDEITDEEVTFANELNIPIFYRKKKKSTIKNTDRKQLRKRYTSVIEKKLF